MSFLMWKFLKASVDTIINGYNRSEAIPLGEGYISAWKFTLKH